MPDIAGKLFPNLTTLIVQLLSTGVLLLIFKKYLWKNVMEYFAKRADYIESTINEAKEMNEKASANLETAEKEAREAASKYRDILDQAKDDGQKVRQQIIDQANEEIIHLISQILEEGYYEDSKKRKISFENVIIILSQTNITHRLGFKKNKTIHPRHPLLSKVDQVIEYQPLSKETIEKIISKKQPNSSNKLHSLIQKEKNPTLSHILKQMS